MNHLPRCKRITGNYAIFKDAKVIKSSPNGREFPADRKLGFGDQNTMTTLIAVGPQIELKWIQRKWSFFCRAFLFICLLLSAKANIQENIFLWKNFHSFEQNDFSTRKTRMPESGLIKCHLISAETKTSEFSTVCISPQQIFDKMIKFAGFFNCFGSAATCFADWWIPNGLKKLEWVTGSDEKGGRAETLVVLVSVNSFNLISLSKHAELLCVAILDKPERLWLVFHEFSFKFYFSRIFTRILKFKTKFQPFHFESNILQNLSTFRLVQDGFFYERSRTYQFLTSANAKLISSNQFLCSD